jgi:hypothetical protein
VVVKPGVYRHYREVIRFSPLVVVNGVVQRAGRVVNVLVQQVEPLPG